MGTLSLAKADQGSEILVICINYHTDADARAFVADLLVAEGVEKLSILIVDNSQPSTLNGCLMDILARSKNVSILVPKENMGYYGGAAWALNKYLADRPLPDWTVVSNVDLRIRDKGFFKCLVDYGLQHGFSVIAPAISSDFSLRDQNPFMRIRPNPRRMRFYKFVFKYYPTLVGYYLLSLFLAKVKSMNRKSLDTSITANNPVPIYAPHGSFIAFKKIYFEMGGTLNHPVFLFGEEIFVAETARKLGLMTGYDPRLRVIHSEHKSTGYIPSRKVAAYMAESAAYCAEVFFGKGRYPFSPSSTHSFSD